MKSHRLASLSNRLLSGLLAASVLGACATDMAEESELDDLERGDVNEQWSYILDNDFALRNDGAGQGWFLAARTHGLHNGIDILGTVGAPLYAPCTGQVLTGVASGFGNYAQVVCPIPTRLTKGQQLFASIFYAHMNSFGPSTSRNQWVNIANGGQVGTVGKTGNAGSSNAHVHFEVVIHSSAQAARSESHAGSDQGNNAATDSFISAITETCLTPNGIRATQGLRRARRVDPFVFLACMGSDKPAVKQPPSSLQSSLVPWSRFYSASSFNVDTENLANRTVTFEPMEIYWARNTDGSYKLHALPSDRVQSIGYFVDNTSIAAASRQDGANFPETYTFSLEKSERLFEARGFDANGDQIALGVGLLDVTTGPAVFIRQLGEGYYDIGLDQAPEAVAFIKVQVDGRFLLTNELTGDDKGKKDGIQHKVRYRFGTLGERTVQIQTFNADGTQRGTLHRTFNFR